MVILKLITILDINSVLFYKYFTLKLVMTQTYEKSFTHFKTAADLGHSKSLFELAEIYEKGIGRNVSYKLAYKYLINVIRAKR